MKAAEKDPLCELGRQCDDRLILLNAAPLFLYILRVHETGDNDRACHFVVHRSAQSSHVPAPGWVKGIPPNHWIYC